MEGRTAPSERSSTAPGALIDISVAVRAFPVVRTPTEVAGISVYALSPVAARVGGTGVLRQLPD